MPFVIPPIVAAISEAAKIGLLAGVTEVAKKAVVWAGEKVVDFFTDDDSKQSNVAGKAVDDVLGKQSQNVTTNNGQMQQGNIIIHNYFQDGKNAQERNVLISIDNVGGFEKAQQYRDTIANGKSGTVATVTPQNVPSNVISLSYQNKTAKIHSNNADKIMQMSSDVASNVQGIDKLDIGGEIYTILKGDSLYKIAKENNITLDELRKANSWVEDRFSKDQRFALIYPGEKLVVPTKENFEKTVQQETNNVQDANSAAATQQAAQEETKETTLSDIAKTVGEGAKAVLKGAVVGAVVTKVIIDKALDLAKEAVSEAGAKIADKISDIKENVEGAAKTVVGAIETFKNEIKGVDQKVTEAIDETIKSAKAKVDEAQTKVLDKVDEIKKDLQEAKQAVSDKIDEVKDRFENDAKDSKADSNDKSQSLEKLVGKEIGQETLAKGQAESKANLEEASKNTRESSANQDNSNNENDNVRTANA
jgi:LysM repeat protein